MDLPKRPIKDPYKEIPVKDFSYVNTKKGLSKKDKKTNLKLIGISLVLLIILGAAAYFYGHATRDNKKHAASTSSPTVVKKLADNIYSPTTTSYNSSSFGFNIKYPSSWQSSSNGSASVEFTSPVVPLTTDTGNKVNGEVIMSAVNAGQIPSGFGNTSVAVLDSVDLSFDSPSADQAAQSYISFVQYPATNIKGGLDGIYLTGNNGYLKDDNIPISDIKQMTPLIYIAFYKCMNEACTNTEPLTISSTMWSDANFANAITRTIESIVFS